MPGYPIAEEAELSLVQTPKWRAASGRFAYVVEGRDGCKMLPRNAMPTRTEVVRGGLQHVYLVDLRPRELPVDYKLPSSEFTRKFRADMRITVQVTNAVKVVESGVGNAWDAIEQLVGLPLRQISGEHELSHLAEAEQQLHAYLVGREFEELGMRIVRAGVSLSLTTDDLKYERERIEEEHRRRMETLHAIHRAELKEADEGHRRKLAALQAEHDRTLESELDRHRRDLETRRRERYAKVMQEGLLPGLILLRLANHPTESGPTDLDELIRMAERQRWDNLATPLRLLKENREVVRDWQLEKAIDAVLERLAEVYTPANRDDSASTEIEQGEAEALEDSTGAPAPEAEAVDSAPFEPQSEPPAPGRPEFNDRAEADARPAPEANST